MGGYWIAMPARAQGDDNKLHLQWRDRTRNNAVEHVREGGEGDEGSPAAIPPVPSQSCVCAACGALPPALCVFAGLPHHA